MDHEHLRSGLNSMLNWMDVRHDQGQSVARDGRALQKLFAVVERKYKRIGPSGRVLRDEPDDLPGIRALCLPGPAAMWDKFDARLYSEKLRGALLCRLAGCTLGAAVEFQPIEVMQQVASYTGSPFPPTDYWKAAPSPWQTRYGMDTFNAYLRQNIRYVPVDDDVTYTLLGLLILEDFGPAFTTADVGKAWLKYLPMACTAEDVALKNLKKGIRADRVGEFNNPFVEWIGADIRSDPWGYVAPGVPQLAAELAYRDAYVSHRHSGIYGEMYFAAAIAAAFAAKHPLDACGIALGQIPAKSRAAVGVRWALDTAPKVKDYLHARRLVDQKFKGMAGPHTVNNAALTIFGLALGGRDVTKVIGNTVAMGMDNDCTAATAGSIVGAVVGAANVPPHWYKPFRNNIRTYMIGQEWFRIDDVVNRFARQAAAVWRSTDAKPSK